MTQQPTSTAPQSGVPGGPPGAFRLPIPDGGKPMGIKLPMPG